MPEATLIRAYWWIVYSKWPSPSPIGPKLFIFVHLKFAEDGNLGEELCKTKAEFALKPSFPAPSLHVELSDLAVVVTKKRLYESYDVSRRTHKQFSILDVLWNLGFFVLLALAVNNWGISPSAGRKYREKGVQWVHILAVESNQSCETIRLQHNLPGRTAPAEEDRVLWQGPS